MLVLVNISKIDEVTIKKNMFVKLMPKYCSNTEINANLPLFPIQVYRNFKMP